MTVVNICLSAYCATAMCMNERNTNKINVIYLCSN